MASLTQILTRTLFYQQLFFVPQPPTVNTVTIDKWQVPLSRPLQQVLVADDSSVGYFSGSVQNPASTSTIGWLQPFSQSASVKISTFSSGIIFAPGAAVQAADNTITPDKWLMPFTGPRRPIYVTSPDLVFPPGAATTTPSNTVTPDKWLMRFDAPPRYLQPLFRAEPFVPIPATVTNTVTIDKWLQPLGAPLPPVSQQISWPSQPFIPVQATVSNIADFNAWFRPLDSAAARNWQKYGIPPWSLPVPPAVTALTTFGWYRPLSIVPQRLGGLQSAIALANAQTFGVPVPPVPPTPPFVGNLIPVEVQPTPVTTQAIAIPTSATLVDTEDDPATANLIRITPL